MMARKISRKKLKTWGKKPKRIRRIFRSIALACTLGISALMPLKAGARDLNSHPGISGENLGGSNIHSSETFTEIDRRDPSEFRFLERSGLSFNIPIVRIRGMGVSLTPYGYSWKLQEIPFGGGLLLNVGASVFGGEWNGRYGALFTAGISRKFSGGLLELMPQFYFAPASIGIGGRLNIGLRLSRDVKMVADAYLMGSRPGNIDSMNFMGGLSFGN